MSRKLVNVTDFLRMAHSNVAIPRMRNVPVTQRNGITQKQRDFLHRLGLGYSQLHYHAQVQAVLDVALERERHGLATPAQMRAMEDRGIENIHLKSKDEASYLLNGGKPENYDGFVVVFRFGGNNKVTGCSKSDARNIAAWLSKEYGKYEYKII